MPNRRKEEQERMIKTILTVLFLIIVGIAIIIAVMYSTMHFGSNSTVGDFFNSIQNFVNNIKSGSGI